MHWNTNDNEIRLTSNLYFEWAEKRIRECLGQPIQIEMTGDFWDDEDAIMFADLRGANKIAQAISQVCQKKQVRIALCGMRLEKILLNNQPIGNRNVTFNHNEMIVYCSFADRKDHFSVGDLKEVISNKIQAMIKPFG